LWEEKIKRGTRRREIMLKKEEDKRKLKLKVVYTKEEAKKVCKELNIVIAF
jgi:hypothetical protein